MSKFNFDILDKIFDKFQINEGKNIYLGVDLMYVAGKLNIFRLDPEDIADEILNFVLTKIGKKGNLILPVFNFDCVPKALFNRCKSAGQSGGLGNLLLKKNYRHRSSHPLHSFLCFGNDANKFINMNNKNSTGEDSPWKFFIEDDFIILSLGQHYNRSLTIVHYLENLVGVNYRQVKDFSLNYIDFDNIASKRKYSFYARKPELCKISGITKKCDNFFIDNNIANFLKIENFISFKLNLKLACDVIIEDLKKNSENFLSYAGSNDPKKEKNILIGKNLLDLEKTL